MRKAYNDNGFIEEDGKLVGISFGFDFCSEHEWGIKGIIKALGIKTEARDPWARHQITKFPENFIYHTDKKSAYLMMFNSEWEAQSAVEHIKSYLDGDLSLWRDEEFASAWDEKSFGVRVKGEANVEKLGAIVKAFQNNDIAYGFTKSAWKGRGLVFAIDSAIPEEDKEATREDHRSMDRLAAAVKKTGIEEILKKAECRYYALSPKWKDPEDESKGFQFWLNPADQKDNNYGWYVIADLKLWAKGEGRIPMKKKEKA